MCRNPETTAPLTTLPTMTTATMSPSTPNVARSGTYTPMSEATFSLTTRYGCAATSASAGSPAVTAASRASTAAFVETSPVNR